MYKEQNFTVKKYSSREELRRIVVNKFLDEKPGLGTGDLTSRHRYYVETLDDGRRIYLDRPAYLKKGFDFRINVERTRFQNNKEYPKHDDIFDDLNAKIKDNPKAYKKLHEAIIRVYNCEDPSDILPEYQTLKFNTGHPVDLILKVIKWFFIEQDIRDWNYSGRHMFKEALDSIFKSNP